MGQVEQGVPAAVRHQKCMDALNIGTKKLAVGSGGGGNYGIPDFCKEYFIDPVKYIASKDATGCDSNFKAVTSLPEELLPLKGPIDLDWLKERPVMEKSGDSIFKFRNETVPLEKRPIQLVFGYDIICQLIPHLKNANRWFIPYLGVFPVMHAFAHDGACRTKYLGSISMGDGIEDNETCERTNSITGEGVANTRNMQEGNRQFNVAQGYEIPNRRNVKHLEVSLELELTNCMNTT
ncbi:hypothetical protein BCR33DRAFT_827588 [Rhizoclosmatium globosum]|uniref:Uncharacterized protein n=1 Tax=Rhizoclosmatium globosum TaxID=329046 RepID=A0A1Y2C163_9FUNG|nr:hypothetical protein BCR33DRAFT_827588 [Rhizoclosmatium globosum]|eukprot:ORY40759.1 hypothetical protein BCR33DRAFT_827588 [Rhizoclosmatium globosum]